MILSEEFFNHPYEIVFRALSESIKLIGKKYYPVRGKKLDRILKDMDDYIELHNAGLSSAIGILGL